MVTIRSKQLKTILIALHAAALATLINPVYGVPITTLVAGGTITQGDKLFSNFSAECAPSNCGPQFNEPLDIVGFTDASGNFGLHFRWLNGDIEVPVSIEFCPSCPPDIVLQSVSISYTVSVLTPGLSVVDADLAGDPSLGGPVNVPSSLTVTESFQSLSNTNVVNDVFFPPPDNQVTVDTASTSFSAHTSLDVTTQLSINNFIPNFEIGILSFVDETFSQGPTPPPGTAPEPSSLLLLSGALLCMGAVRRRARAHRRTSGRETR